MIILSISDFHGSVDVLGKTGKRIKEIQPDLIVFTGDIVKGSARGDEWLKAKTEGRPPNKDLKSIKAEEKVDLELYFKFYEWLNSFRIPAVTIPGNMDAPAERYFKIMMEAETVHENIISVHGRHIRIGRNFVIGGFGGELTQAEKEEFFVLQYPAWEAKYHLGNLAHEEHDKILLLHTPPVSKLDLEGGSHKGSNIVNELIKSLTPKFAFCGHAHNCQGKDII